MEFIQEHMDSLGFSQKDIDRINSFDQEQFPDEIRKAHEKLLQLPADHPIFRIINSRIPEAEARKILADYKKASA